MPHAFHVSLPYFSSKHPTYFYENLTGIVMFHI